MKRTVGKLITILLCLTMILSLVPVSALASEEAQAQTGVVADIPGGSIGDIIDELGKLPDLVATPTPADPTGSCGEALTWHLSLSTGVLTVSGSGAMPDYASNGAPWYSYRGKIKSVVLDAGITNIGAYAFDGLANMTAIELPASIERIGKNAFYGCKKLASIELPDSITEIGISAFSYCSALTKVTLPAGITTVPSAAFAYCSSLKEVVLHDGITKLGTFAFIDCISLPNITLPEALTTIDSDAFHNCAALTAIAIPDSVTFIGHYAFAYSGLEYVAVPDGIEDIDNCFYYCKSLKSIYLPKSVVEIYKSSFNGCESLTDVYYGGSKLDWKDIIIDELNDELLNATFHYNASGLPDDMAVVTPAPTAAPTPVVTPAPTAAPTPTPVATPAPDVSLEPGWVNVPGFMTVIYDDDTYTMNGIGKVNSDYGLEMKKKYDDRDGATIEHIVFEGNVIIGDDFFTDYADLKTLTIKADIAFIGQRAFAGCENLSEITLPETLEKICNGAFSGCTNLETVHFNGTEEDWNKYVAIGKDNEALTSATITFGNQPRSTVEHAYKNGLCMHCGATEATPNPTPNLPGAESISGKCGEKAMWNLDVTNGILTISGTGATEDYIYNTDGQSDTPWYYKRGEIKSIVVENGITSIGNGIFTNCTRAASVSLPDTLVEIGDGAFAFCQSLKTIQLPNSITVIGKNAFAACRVTEVVLPKNLTEISSGLFMNCHALPAINLPDGVTAIGDNAFYGCRALETLVIPDSVVQIGKNALDSDNTGIKNLSLPNGIETIDFLALVPTLEKIYIPASVKTIESDQFVRTENLTDVYYGGTEADWEKISVGPLNKYLSEATIHYNCTGLSDGDAVTPAPTAAPTPTVAPTPVVTPAPTVKPTVTPKPQIQPPYDCPEDVCGPNAKWSFDEATGTLTITGEGDMYSYIGRYPAWYQISDKITTVVIKEGITSIGENVFGNCVNVETMAIPATVTYIGIGAFTDCDALCDVFYAGSKADWENVTIEDKLDSSFYGNSNILKAYIHYNSNGIVDLPTYTPNSNQPGGECGPNAVWSFNTNSGLLTIKGRGPVRTADWSKYNSVIREVVIEEGITAFDGVSFGNCSSLKKMKLADSIVFIDYTFSPRTTLESFNLPASLRYYRGGYFDTENFYITDLTQYLEVFSGQQASMNHITADNTYLDGKLLTDLVIPEGITAIPDSAFCYWKSLETVTIPNSVETIGNSAFQECRNLNTVTLSENLKTLETDAFYRCSKLTSITIPASMEMAMELAFGECGLKTIIFEGNAPLMASDTFGSVKADAYYPAGNSTWTAEKKENYGGELNWIEGLPSAPTPVITPAPTAKPEVPENPSGPSGTCGENATWVLDEATGTLIISGTGEMKNYGWSTSGETDTPWYSNRAKIKSIVVEEGITSIGNDAFSNCVRVKSIALPDSLVTVGGYAFAFCKSLETIDLPDSITEIRSDAFRSCEELTRIVLPKNITAIPNDLFIDCTSLMEVIIPESVTTIGGMAFYGCKALTKIILPEGLTSIDLYTFASCKALETLVIPNSVSQISAGAFFDCAIKYLSLPNTLDSVNYLGDLYSLEAVYIPKEILLIESGQFSTCTKFTDVYYGGSEQDWEDMIIEDDNDYLLNATIHYNASGLPESMVPVTPAPTPVITPAPTAAPTPTPEFVPDPNWKHGDCGENAKWYFDDSTGTLHVIGSGRLNNYGAAMPPPWYCYGDPGEFCHLITKAEFSEGITFLGAGFLWGCNITEFTVPSTVTEIDCFFFEECARLTNIVIPKSVKTISTFAFAGCGVKNVYYEGTEEEWKQIKIGEEGNGALFKANIIYSYDGSPIPTIKPTTTPTPTPTAKPTPTPYVPVEPTVNPNLDPTTCKHTLFFVAPKNATCTEQGFTGKVICGKGCGHVLQDGKVKPALGHNYKNGSCTRCGHVDGAPVVPPPAGDTPFVDMTTNDWFYEPVLWAVENGITGGTSANTFSPNGICTRAQIVTFLWAAAGKPEPTSKSPFADVKSDDWFYKPVIWAVENDITSGTTASTFSPNIPCSRAQVVALLYKAMGAPEVTTTENPFADVNENNYFYPAVLWALENKVASGVTADKFGSSQPCTRAQIAMFLYKAYN